MPDVQNDDVTTSPHGDAGLYRDSRMQARALAGGRVEYDGDFPDGIGALLADRQERGMTFDEAWTKDLDEAAKKAGFTWKSQPGHAESSLSFAKRHFRAAYEGVETSMYCVVTTCTSLTINIYGLCDEHADDAA